MPLQQTSGAASYDAFGGGAPVAAKYIEDFFQTWLRTGTGSSTTVTTGLNASINKSLVWTKSRSAATNHKLTDTARGVTKALSSNTTGAEVTDSQGLTAFSSTGYTIGTNTDYNNSGATYVDWQWVATPKFFDVVTYTGNGANRTIAHNLGSVPGCIIVKRTDTTAAWQVYHRSLANTEYMVLNTTNGKATGATRWNSTTPTATEFSLGTDTTVNNSGSTYVAYLFAHDAGGFGLTGTDNVITCGSYTGNGSTNGPTVTLGYEPQWILIKAAGAIGAAWHVHDVMRGIPTSTTGITPDLQPSSSNAESTGYTNILDVTATGFRLRTTNDNWNGSGEEYIYIAIRRGPMKTPTTGANVFQPYNAPDNSVQSVGFPTDMYLDNRKAGASYNTLTGSRLIGTTLTLSTASAAAQTTSFGPSGGFDSNTAFAPSMIGEGTVWYSFRRAPGFFDVVCYTGTGGLGTVTHNLGVVPELMIVKSRSNALDWIVYSQPTGNNWILKLNSSGIGFSTDYWQDTTPTATSVFLSGVPDNEVYGNGITYVMYLFASCPGVSKVGSFTGTGATQVINCGFTGGARFVLIKRTDSAGDWYVWDSARGIVAGNDPYLMLNSTAAEVTNTDWVDTAATGFELSNAAGNLANINGASYIFLAVS